MTPTAAVHEFTAELVVRQRNTPADGVVLLDLGKVDGADLPRWEPGAHIDLLLDNALTGLTRQYSLCGNPAEPSVWRVGVLLDPHSRGGSAHVHVQLREGATVRVRGPRNHFPFIDSAGYRFIAGGIGITPIGTMIEAAQRTGSEWTLLYGGRTRASMAFAGELQDRYPDRVTIWPQDERGQLDFEALLKEPRDDTLIYCCGPEALLQAVEDHCTDWAAGALHIERFAGRKPADNDTAGEAQAFEVVCQQSGMTLDVGPEQSILEVLEEAGVFILGGCYGGVCGTCEARVLEGTPEHRDSVLDPAEQAANEVMMVCVSRCRSGRLVLDL
ncbi:PDR/VanB family oxidoreductase [Mycolicibacterium septicum]|uniref:PDR/VanB family oxidoreductase n=1 Tax=Mycolicibacterium septicum TaxID=98668 RepID=UPI00236060D6|nr:PDR/VanB family oxidoreductase [Mycolicibacterium septicum]